MYEIDIDIEAEGAVILHGLEEAIIGITEDFGYKPRLLYSKIKILEILEQGGMTREDALEYYNFNILGMYVNEQNPIFLDIPIKAEKINDDIKYCCDSDIYY